MSPTRTALQRLQFLACVVRKESRQLADTDRRLFAVPFSEDCARLLDSDPELGERVEAFVSRFGRLQDALGDKLLPQLLGAIGEPPGVMIDNLGKAERFGYIDSADEWITMRKLRNQMIHEYIEDPAMLANAL